MAVYRVGTMIRETGQALERLGCRLMGVDAFKEEILRHRNVMNLGFMKPTLGTSAWVAPSASVVGNVSLGNNASVWRHQQCGNVGDESAVTVGEGTNVQDGATVGVGLTSTADKMATLIGKNVTIGHKAILSGCTIEDECLIGMGAVIKHGVHMETGSMLAAGTVVPVDTRIPAKQLWAGNPAKYMRDLKPDESAFLPVSAQKYIELAQQHASVTAAMQEKLDA